LGSRIVSPLKEGDDILAIKEAAVVPTLFKELAEKYDQCKLPREDIAHNVIANMGIPAERLESSWSIFKANAKFSGLLQIISGNEYLCCQQNTMSVAPSDAGAQENQVAEDAECELPREVMERMNIAPVAAAPQVKAATSSVPNIFISHGKNSTTIIGQLKELISYGQMNPVVSVEHETTAIPVPTKVFDDMRACDAGIIHINLEECCLTDGTRSTQINENVLIEIGAAMALYGDRIILLCEKDARLPSNLQGLYRCEYNGDQLDYNSTIKLLKAMQEIRQKISNN
jgi:predicted nucleotide-binding protein